MKSDLQFSRSPPTHLPKFHFSIYVSEFHFLIQKCVIMGQLKAFLQIDREVSYCYIGFTLNLTTYTFHVILVDKYRISQLAWL